MADINGTSGNDVLKGTDGSDAIYGFGGDDVIDGIMGTDFIYGGDGNDRIIFSGVRVSSPAPALGVIDGGAGFDEIDVSNLSPTSLSGNRIYVGNQGFELSGIERVILGNSNQFISGTNISYEIVTGTGNDRSTITGSANINSGAGNDYFFVSSDTQGPGGSRVTSGSLNGGAGTDTLSTNILAKVDLLAGTAKVWNASYSISGFENVTVTGYGTDTTVYGDNSANVISASGSDWAGVYFDGRGGSDTLNGSAYSDTIRGGDGNDIINGLGGRDFIFGDGGNDVISALGDGDTIDGGAGFDIVNYSGLARSYGVSSENMRAHVSLGKTADDIINAETIHFRDADLSFDEDSNAAFIMRLYDTVLHREPDAFGLDSWLDRMNTGMSKSAVAAGFVGSPEFAKATGDLSTPDFVEFLYVSALGRSSDAAGKDNWIKAIEGGLSRADAVIGFSESAEHRIQTADILAKGLWVTQDNFQQVTALYDTFANRLPDQPGLLDWVNKLDSGTSLRDVAAGFAGSMEFSSKTSGLSNADLVEFMYVNTLDRSADAAGKQSWVNALDKGMSKGDLLLGFSASDEHFQLMADHIYSGVDYII